MEAEIDIIPMEKPKRFFVLSPALILLHFALVLAATVLSDLIVYKTCFISFNFNETECLVLRNNSESPEARNLELEVEPYASIIVMAYYSEKNMLSAVCCLFLGSWSDRGGRRPPLLAAMIGITLMYLTLSFMAEWRISPWYFLAAATPANIVGGMWTVRLIIICYVSDTSKGKGRMLQMALLDASHHVGAVLGGLISPSIYKNYGYANVFRAAAICACLSSIYTFFFIPETVKNSSKESLRSFFKTSFIKDFAKSVFSQRKGFDRFVVWPAIVVLAIHALLGRGKEVIQFLFTRTRLGWDVQHYSYFSVTDVLLRFACLCLLFLCRYFSKVPDTFFAAVSELLALSGAITFAFAWKSWHMYLGSSIGVFGALTVPITHSVIARFVPAKDVGKVFSFIVLLEALISLAGPPLFTLIYSNYLPPIYPSPLYISVSTLFITSITCSIFIHLRVKKFGERTIYVAAPQGDSEFR